MKKSTFTLSLLFSFFFLLYSTNTASAQQQCCCDVGGGTTICLNFSAAGGGDCIGSCALFGFTNSGSVPPYPDAATCTSDCTVVPIELSHFTAKVTREGVVQLKWTTESEIDNRGFEIQRMSGIDLDWETIDFVEGQGTSFESQEYSYYDRNPPLGINYYRLEQVDFGGATSLSPIESVNQDPKAVFSVWPTVARDQVFLMLNEDYHSEDIVVQVRDLMGKLLVEQSVDTRVIDINTFSPGHYLISFYVRGQMYTQQFIKAN